MEQMLLLFFVEKVDKNSFKFSNNKSANMFFFFLFFFFYAFFLENKTTTFALIIQTDKNVFCYGATINYVVRSYKLL